MTNTTGTVTATVNYDAFGQVLGTTGSSSNAYMFGANSGYRNDNDAGLLYVGARYYDPQVGRFTTPDTDLDENPYLYCEHDPVNYTDPTGHWPTFGKLLRLLALYGNLHSGLSDPENDNDTEPKRPQIKIERPDPNKKKKPGDNGNSGSGGSGTNKVTQVAGGAAALYLGWQVLKWGVAIFAAPESGGLSLGLAAGTP